MKTKILIVDDEPGILSSLSGILEDEGFETVTASSGTEALTRYTADDPDLVFLDIWLPDKDGLEVLQTLREIDPRAMVIMISGHGTIATAVKAIKMGAFDYIEKPLSYSQVLEGVRNAVTFRTEQMDDGSLLNALSGNRDRIPTNHEITPPETLAILREGNRYQQTIAKSTVVYGLGLFSGHRTGMIMSPLPPDSGIHFLTLPGGTLIPAHVNQVADTVYATILSREDEQIRTVEHFLSALHALGIDNLLVKVHGEIPVMDGSAAEFFSALESAGLERQDRLVRELVIDKPYEIKGEGEELLRIEPAEKLSVHYELRYPEPIGEQMYEFTINTPYDYFRDIAGARTFGFLKDLQMLNELGIGSGGRLDNCILVGEDSVVNTDLRYPDEFVRHKILDIIGDTYLLGFPVRGRITARYTGHRHNIRLLKEIQSLNRLSG